METAKILSKAPNRAVVHIPGRSFPGAVIQGDDLHWLVNRLILANQYAAKQKDPDLIFILMDLKSRLEGIYNHYAETIWTEIEVCQVQRKREK